MSSVELGCGLVAIGRPWGTTAKVPSETDAIDFLQSAYDSGIRFFDTAPSYGLSEERLGHFLDTLTPQQRTEVIVATKFGEHWDKSQEAPYTDHSLEALKRSLDNSKRLLGQIAILQLHKATPELLNDSDIHEALDYAMELGIPKLGVSVSDPATAEAAIADPKFSVLQLPYNASSPIFQEVIHHAEAAGKELLINRPFQMGRISANSTPDNKRQLAIDAFRFILQEDFNGVVLTGTSNSHHLQENIEAFNKARSTA